MSEKHYVEALPVTSGKHHWFGYYDKFPWDATGRYLLGLESTFVDRQPTGEERAVVGMIDLQDNNRWIPLDETLAWCWQQGTMLQWLPSAPDRKIIYNQRDGDRFVSIIRDVFTGETKTLPRPIYCVRPDGKRAVTLNFARLDRRRPGYGYPGVVDAWAHDPHPVDDGIFSMDLETGESQLIISYDLIRHNQPNDTFNEGQHWVNHLAYAPDGKRFVFRTAGSMRSRTRRENGWTASTAPGTMAARSGCSPMTVSSRTLTGTCPARCSPGPTTARWACIT
ncbi:MAG: hypothetical protein IPK19_07200 [Chloroflexi bacterium]|nr:hypothetical protein [Chloroflexota bacterium]